MLTNYIKIALRNIQRNKLFAFITIFGLSLGMACCILLMLTVHFEQNFDTFHEKNNRIYRIGVMNQSVEGVEPQTSCPVPLAPTMKAELPSVEYASRFSGAPPATLKYNNTAFREYPVFVDADFVKIFSLNFLQGSADAALKDVNSLVLTKEIADKMFGENAIALGKQVTMQIDGEFKPFAVTGVIQNLPPNSSLDLSVLVRFDNGASYKTEMTHWDNFSTETYFSLQPNITQQDFERSVVPFVEKHFAEVIKSKLDVGIRPNERGKVLELRAQPLHDWHFNTLMDKSGTAKNTFYSLIAIAFLIVLIAAINFVNLSIARSFTRSREIGIRKTVGAQKHQLVGQFLGESLVIVGLALFVGIVLAEALLPLYNSLMRLKLTLLLSGGVAENLVFWGGMIGLLLVVGISAAAYPAFYLSNLQAASTMKSRSQGVSPSTLRNILVVVQFALAVGLIACTMIIRNQTEFMKKKSLGFNRDGIVVIPTGDGANGAKTLERYRARLAGNPSIVNMSAGLRPIGRGLDGSDTHSHMGRSYNGGEVSVDVLWTYFNYIETLEIPLLAGRTFDKAHIASDSLESVIMNESAARQVWSLMTKEDRLKRAQNGEFTPSAIIGFSVPSGEKDIPPMNIIGVTKDYHMESLRRKIVPAIQVMWRGYSANYIFARIRLENMSETLQAMESAWREVSPDVPWQGSLADENIERLYRTYTRQTNLIMTAASIAVALSCIGLFALAAIAMAARTKEIGIRKVLGASVSNIISLLSRDFLKLVGVGIVVATPLAWWMMQSWLQSFAYRTELGAGVFIISGLLAVSIAFMTVAGQAFRAARANPVNSLRSE